ncbi:MAG: PadR family transcriptional regulator [Holophagales bacterium]|nr:PadR family transcriptional regulator [Holophagales bacterium]
MPPSRSDLQQGTLELLILRTLALGPLHGWAISQRIRQLSKDVLQVQQGSLYPTLYRLRDQGLVRSEQSTSEEGRRVRIYHLTASGRQRLEQATESWRTLTTAVEAVLSAT